MGERLLRVVQGLRQKMRVVAARIATGPIERQGSREVLGGGTDIVEAYPQKEGEIVVNGGTVRIDFQG